MRRRNFLIAEYEMVDSDPQCPTLYNDFFIEMLNLVEKFDEIKEREGFSLEVESVYINSISDLVRNALSMRPISPITEDESEWMILESPEQVIDLYGVSFEEANNIYESLRGNKVNKRVPYVFYKNDKTYFAHGITFVDVITGDVVRGPVENVTEAPPIKLPKSLRAFKVNVYQDISGHWRFKDRTEVDKALNYFLE